MMHCKKLRRLILPVLLSFSSIIIPETSRAAEGPLAFSSAITLYSVRGTSARNVYAVGSDGAILHYDGKAWADMSKGLTYNLSNVWCSKEGAVFAVGRDGVIVRFGGNVWGTWTPMASGTTNNLFSLWGSTEHDIFAVGANGTIVHYDGVAWSAVNSGTTNLLFTVWGSSGTDVFAAGFDGTILHYDGGSWSRMTSGTRSYLYGIWGAGSDVFAVGSTGTILHYNGHEWTAMPSGTASHLYGIWGNSANDVFAVGTSGTILHFDGSAWNVLPSAATHDLYAVWSAAGNDVFAVGGGGTILHYDGRDWISPVPVDEIKAENRQKRTGSSPANWYFGIGVFVLAEDGLDFQFGFRPDQSHWQYGWRLVRWTDTSEDPFTGRDLTTSTETKTGPFVNYLFTIDGQGSFYLGVAVLQWSRTEKSLMTGESDSASTTALFGGGGYQTRLSSLFYFNIGILLSPGTSLSTKTSVSSEETSGAFDVQLQLGVAF